jgi:hypothetical protein
MLEHTYDGAHSIYGDDDIITVDAHLSDQMFDIFSAEWLVELSLNPHED